MHIRFTLLVALLFAFGKDAVATPVDLSGWNIHTEQSGTLRCQSNWWQQAELYWGYSYVSEGSYLADQISENTIEIKADCAGEPRNWRLRREGANYGAYTLDYTLYGEFDIHEEGRYYNSQAGLQYADWAQVTGQLANSPSEVWQYLIGTDTPQLRVEKTGNTWALKAPEKLAGRNGVVALEESVDLKAWTLCRNAPTIGAEKQRYYRLKAELAQPAVIAPGGAVLIAERTIVPNSNTSIAGFSTIKSLEISGVAATTSIKITETAMPVGNYKARPLTGLIGIQGLEQAAAQPIEVRLNLVVSKDDFVMGFIYDRSTGKFEGMPLKELAVDHVTVMSRHFCEFLLLKIPIAELPDEVDTGFRPGVDDWEFRNLGSYIAPRGHCAGQALSAMYYYVTQRKANQAPKLFELWDNPGNNWATPSVETDNQKGYALASVVQKSITFDSFANSFWYRLDNDLNTYRCFVFSMWITEEPQEVGIYREGGGHAVVGWKCAYGSIHVADPNYPGNDTRWINYNTTSNKFEPYNSGANALELGRSYPKISYFGKTTMVDWGLIGNLWQDAEKGTIGSGDFPFVTIRISNTDKSTACLITNTMKGGIIPVAITGNAFQLGGDGWQNYWVYNEDGSVYELQGGWVILENNTAKFGVELFDNVMVGTNSVSSWVGFQWFNVTKTNGTVGKIAITLTPTAVTLAAGASQQFTATVTGTANTGVYWGFDGSSGNPSGGTLTQTGLYTAPNYAGTFTIMAMCMEDHAVVARATITVPFVATKFSQLTIYSSFGSNYQSGPQMDSEDIPVVWSGNDFAIVGSTIVKGYNTENAVTLSISGTVYADGTISLRGTSHSVYTVKWLTSKYDDVTEATASIELEHGLKNPLYQDAVHWMITGLSNPDCLKSVASETTVTRKYYDGTAKLQSTKTWTKADWDRYSNLRVNGS